jgi:hypothetical protein
MVDPGKLKEYHTNPVNWVCACRSFLCSRFLLCKHIVHCFESPSPEFFQTVSRQTTYPFWKDRHLVLRPEYTPMTQSQIQGLDIGGQRDNNAEERQSDSDSYESESEPDEEAVPIEVRVAECRKMMQGAMDLFEDQVAKGNDAFLERFMVSTQSIGVLLEEVKHRRNKRSMPRTWGRYRHPATMYVK